MPILDEGWLLPRKTKAFMLGPINANESTIDGTYNIYKIIFLEQLKLKEESDFDSHLYLCYSD